jgi:hypothetical protein
VHHKSSRMVPAVVLLAALFAASPGAVGAASPPHGIAVYQQVQRSTDPTATWAALSPAEQQAYRDAMQGVTLRVIKAAPVRVAAPTAAFAVAAGNVSPMTSSCWTWTWEVDGLASFGIVVFRYFQDMGWCDNGNTITNITWHERRGQADGVGWSYTPTSPAFTMSGGVGYSSWRSYTTATFQFCLPACVQWRYPWLDMTAWPGGGGTGSIGGAN